MKYTNLLGRNRVHAKYLERLGGQSRLEGHSPVRAFDLIYTRRLRLSLIQLLRGS